MAAQPAVVVSGLKEVRAAVRRLAPEMVPEFRDQMKSVGERVVADAKARTPVGMQTWNKKKGEARDSLRVTSGGNTLYIVGGKAKVPWFGWLDFGGVLLPTGQQKVRTRYRSSNGFRYLVVGQATGRGRTNRIERPYRRRGRIIYAAIDANASHIIDKSLATIDAMKRRLGL